MDASLRADGVLQARLVIRGSQSSELLQTHAQVHDVGEHQLRGPAGAWRLERALSRGGQEIIVGALKVLSIHLSYPPKAFR
jgi:hypothetical protein